MADAAAKKILALLDPRRPAEVRAAATLVLGELGAPDADVVRAVVAALDDADASVRIQAIRAAAKLKATDAIATLVARIEKGGDEAHEAAHAAAKLGPKATKALQDLTHKVAPGLRRYIAAALGAAGNASADAAAVEFLSDKDPGVVDSAVRSLVAQVPTLTPAKKQALAQSLLDLLRPAKTALPSATEAAALRLLAALHDPRAEKVFWERCGPTHPPEIRAAALQALGGQSTTFGKDALQTLFACALESDFKLAAPALVMLGHAAPTAKSAHDWLPLLAAPDIAARRLALDKLAGFDTPEIAAALAPDLRHPDRAFRDAVLARLTEMKHGQATLQESLLDAGGPDATWTLARSLAPQAKNFGPAVRDKLFAQACKLHDANDRTADPLFWFLREADAPGLRDRLEQKALALRKKGDFDGALGYLRMLARDPAIGFALRFELAGCGLRVSPKELAPEARANDPCLVAYGHLIQGYDTELAKTLDKRKWLEPDDLYYLGFHFLEKEGATKKFGAHALQTLVKRSPQSKLAKDAKTKLKASGIG